MLIRFESRFPVKESISKIQNQTMDSHLPLIFSYGPIVGKIKGDKLILQKRSFNYNNPFAKFFYCSISEKQGKTVVEGEFKLHIAIKGAIAIYFSFLFIIMGALSVGLVTPMIDLTMALLGFGLVLFMCIFFLIVFYFVSKASQKEEAFLIEWLQTLLEG